MAVLKEQKEAADPMTHCWVNASAGTGKTKVLIDRLINLLLTVEHPEAVLCLTFTKIAAQEMADRLLHKLSLWATMQENQLLFELQERDLPLSFLFRARNLFEKVLNAPYGVGIQTIHSFCTQILHVGFYDLNLSPSCELLETEDMDNLIHQSIEQSLQESSLAQDLFKRLIPFYSPSRLVEIVESFIKRIEYAETIKAQGGVETYIDILHHRIETTHPFSSEKFEEMKKNIFRLTSQEELLPVQMRLEDPFFFLTTQGEVRKKILKSNLSKKHPHIELLLDDLAKLYQQQIQRTNALKYRDLTSHLIKLATLVERNFIDLKKKKNCLDFNDLLIKSRDLLKTNRGTYLKRFFCPIEHILVDEAQDTSRLQWDILDEVITHFLEGVPKRTLFVVGDHKQSIYSFQGANPTLSRLKKEIFQKRLSGPFKEVELSLSFRTTPAILDVVDETFAPIPLLKTRHHSFRENQPGRVQLLPLTQSPSKDEDPDTHASKEEHHSLFLAEFIESLLQSPTCLPSTKAAAQPGDILVLFQKRSPSFFLLDLALKKKRIPTSGMDRLVIQEFLYVQDLLQLALFVEEPFNDYALACVLKSPLIGGESFLEEELLFIASNRGELSIFEALQKYRALNPRYKGALSFLDIWMENARNLGPFAFFYKLKKQTENHIVSHFGKDALFILDDLLDQVYSLEQVKGASLRACIYELTSSPKQIKSQISGDNLLRIMTIHGSKGLQSPIVILADATQEPSLSQDFFLFCQEPMEPSSSFFSIKPPGKEDSAFFRTYRDIMTSELLDEHQRLLYVGMTRAQDQLYVAGVQHNKMAWYEAIQEGIGALSSDCHSFQPIPFEEAHTTPLSSKEEAPYLHEELPSLNYEERPKKIRPNQKALRGIQLHELFYTLVHREELPHVGPKTAFNYVEEVDRIALLSLKERYPLLFSKKSLSECTLLTPEGPLRPDRVLMDANEILIVDLKTFSPTTKFRREISAQMEQYRYHMEKLYPTHKVSCFVVWLPTCEVEALE